MKQLQPVLPFRKELIECKQDWFKSSADGDES
jgi:hypothetical protein